MTLSSLRLRLLLAAGVFILIATALAALGLAVLFERHVRSWADGELSAQMDQLIAGIDKGADGQAAVVRAPGDTRFARPLSGLYWEVLVEPAGPVYRSRSLWDFEIKLPEEVQVDDSVRHHYVAGPGGSELYLIQRRVELPARLESRTARVAVALDASQLSAAVKRFATALVPFLLLIAGLLIAAAWAQVAIGLRPLGAVRDRLATVASGKETRLGVGFPDEVQPLANEIDALLGAREQQIEKARGRAADLAHGLKTPLQVLAGDIERLRAKSETEIAGEIEKVANAMQRHVDRELARARLIGADANATANVQQVVESVVRVVQRSPNGSRLAWTVNAPETLNVRLDAADLAEAAGNLLENAARHAKSRIVVAAHSEPDGFIALSVSDDGVGIPMALRDRMMQRGARLDTSSGDGAGLGLSIVSDIAASCGGALHMSGPSPDEDGTDRFCVTLRLPAAALRQMKSRT
ncbi:MAG: HAMP domain-containing sensor histidine kinase [Hyphomicrobiaceae bacterium]|nr:HAMP domain-containing sensor histidine kinase [Hyphomicrobiaceae bacterium]